MPQHASTSTVLRAGRGASRRQKVVALLGAFGVVATLGVVATMGSSSAAPTYGPNLLDNSGFWDGVQGWAPPRHRSIALRTVTGGALDSGHSARLVTTKRTNVRLDDRVGQYPTAAARRTYVASAWVRSQSGTAQGYLRIREWSANGVVHTWIQDFTTSDTEWRRVWLEATARHDGDGLQVSVIFPTLAADHPVRVDRVMLREVLTRGTDGASSPPAEPADPSDPPAPGPDPSTSSPAPVDPPTPPAVPASGTLFGASVYSGGTTWTDALASSNHRYGRLDVVRVFSTGLPSPWPGKAGEVGGPVVVSFKASPSAVNAGTYDAFFRDWFAAAPRDREVWWSLWHEPEDDVEAGHFTAQEWRAAFRRLAALADRAGNPHLHNTVILMCWTTNPKSGRSFGDYFPGADVVDTIGWDCYSHPSDPRTYSSPADMYARAIAASRSVGVSWGIAETGSRLVPGDDGTKRAAWLRQVASYLSGQGASFVTYFDSVVGGEFRLLDEPSRAAWHQVVTGT